MHVDMMEDASEAQRVDTDDSGLATPILPPESDEPNVDKKKNCIYIDDKKVMTHFDDDGNAYIEFSEFRTMTKQNCDLKMALGKSRSRTQQIRLCLRQFTHSPDAYQTNMVPVDHILALLDADERILRAQQAQESTSPPTSASFEPNEQNLPRLGQRRCDAHDPGDEPHNVIEVPEAAEAENMRF